jgi:phage terminase large subunit
MTELDFEYALPPKLQDLSAYRRAGYRYISIDGGRGSGKSWAVALTLLRWGIEEPTRFLCCREIQRSIRDSVHKLLSDIIKNHGLDLFYRITDESIKGINGTEFLFKGLWNNSSNIRSTEGIDVCWAEEAQFISRPSMDDLVPTIRKENSLLIFSYNVINDDDPIYVDFNKTDRDDCLKITCNYYDNPFFPNVLRRDMEWDRAHDIDKYLHIWEGLPLRHSQAQIFFGKWSVDEFEKPPEIDPLFGADWGFANDPVALVRLYIKDNCLFVEYETGGIGIDSGDLPELFSGIPGSTDYSIVADSARPETIEYLKRRGFPMIRGAEKPKGSVEDGISFMRSFDRIIIHPRCRKTIDEFRLYCYKLHKLTGEVTRDIVDRNNHYIDAIRYGLEKFYLHVDQARELRDRFGIIMRK